MVTMARVGIDEAQMLVLLQSHPDGRQMLSRLLELVHECNIDPIRDAEVFCAMLRGTADAFLASREGV